MEGVEEVEKVEEVEGAEEVEGVKDCYLQVCCNHSLPSFSP